MNTIYVVTHGDKHNGANPGMTLGGFDQVRALRNLIPAIPAIVICGTGKRHIDVANALGLTPIRYTAVVGDGDSLDTINDNAKVIVLTDGTQLRPEQYTTLHDMAPAAVATVAGLPDQSVVCAGRPSMIMLGKKDAKSATVYKVESDNGRIVSITEVVATGVSEEGTV